jgi:hypothetical protein
MLNVSDSYKVVKRNETKALENLYEGKPNPTDWRSEDLGSIGQPTCIN